MDPALILIVPFVWRGISRNQLVCMPYRGLQVCHPWNLIPSYHGPLVRVRRKMSEAAQLTLRSLLLCYDCPQHQDSMLLQW